MDKKILTITALAVPLIVIPQVHLTFALPKTAALYAFTILCVLAFFVYAIKNKKISWPVLSKKFYIFLGLYLLALGISTVFAIQPHTAIFGSYERQQGLITFVSCLTIFLLIISAKKIFSFIEWICFASFLVAALGILQYFIPELLANYSTSILDGRAIVGTIGNPNFLAAYLITTIPLFFVFQKYAEKKLTKTFWIIAIATSLTAIFLTATRSALVALFVGFIFYAIIKNKKLLILPLILIITFATINLFSETNFIKNHEFLNRLTFSQDSLRSLKSRLYIWPATLGIIKERPIFGYGLGNFREAFSKVSPKELLTLERFTDTTDRAHNEILGTAAAIGILGLIAYLLILFYSIYLGIKNKIKNPFVKAVSFASAISLIMLFANNMFSFSNTEIRLQQFILMGIIFAATPKKTITKKISLKFSTKIIIAILLVAIAIFGIYKLTIKPLIADYYFDKGYSNSFTADKKTTLDYFKKAVLQNPNQTYYSIKSAKYAVISAKLTNGNDKKYFTDTAEFFLQQAVKNIGENQIDTLLVKAEIDAIKENYDLSFANFEKVLQKAPNNPAIILEYSRALADAQKHKESLGMYEKYLNLSTVWQSADASTPEAKKQFRTFFKNAPHFLTAMEGAAEVANKLGDSVKYNYYKDMVKRTKDTLYKINLERNDN
ncbi:MAG: O-antigen ligase [Candidatus Peregrinibacteria bacterium]|nr:O-antigen ligase [Candidatus Peregrinibacteria bacterium]